MKELRSEIEIQATPERVWEVLTDFASFPDWNPFIRTATGTIEAGSRLEVLIQPSGASATTFRPTVLTAQPPRELRWVGHLLVPGLFDGEHSFTIESIGDRCVRFVQQELFRGILVPAFSRQLDRDAQRGFDEMNRALKIRAERE